MAPSAGTGELDDHRFRRREILRQHPEVRALTGSDPITAVLALAIAALQFATAAAMSGRAWWVGIPAAFLVGGFLAHFLNVVIHECSHNLVFRGAAANKACAILANLPGVVPSAMAFRHFHLLHHRFLGRRGLDPDVAPAWEARFIGRGRLGKFAWLLAQPFTYTMVHPLQVKERLPRDRWLVANWSAVGLATLLVAYYCGPFAVGYLALSSYFAVGPHPTGAHILQEHIIFAGHYETASHYGPINAISINHGYHVEHHDFPGIPGARLPRLKRLASRFYEGRFAHQSRLRAMWHFVFDRRVSLDTRIIRQS